jgi:hypothetical protein
MSKKASYSGGDGKEGERNLLMELNTRTENKGGNRCKRTLDNSD